MRDLYIGGVVQYIYIYILYINIYYIIFNIYIIYIYYTCCFPMAFRETIRPIFR